LRINPLVKNPDFGKAMDAIRYRTLITSLVEML
jgi:hypothetical protein